MLKKVFVWLAVNYAKKTESEADYLSRLYFADGSIKGKIRDREGHIDFPVLCPTKIIEFLGIITNLIKTELSISEEKVKIWTRN